LDEILSSVHRFGINGHDSSSSDTSTGLHFDALVRDNVKGDSLGQKKSLDVGVIKSGLLVTRGARKEDKVLGSSFPESDFRSGDNGFKSIRFSFLSRDLHLFSGQDNVLSVEEDLIPSGVSVRGTRVDVSTEPNDGKLGTGDHGRVHVSFHPGSDGGKFGNEVFVTLLFFDDENNISFLLTSIRNGVSSSGSIFGSSTGKARSGKIHFKSMMFEGGNVGSGDGTDSLFTPVGFSSSGGVSETHFQVILWINDTESGSEWTGFRGENFMALPVLNTSSDDFFFSGNVS
jgi:hypothetical protein